MGNNPYKTAIKNLNINPIVAYNHEFKRGIINSIDEAIKELKKYTQSRETNTGKLSWTTYLFRDTTLTRARIKSAESTIEKLIELRNQVEKQFNNEGLKASLQSCKSIMQGLKEKNQALSKTHSVHGKWSWTKSQLTDKADKILQGLPDLDKILEQNSVTSPLVNC